MSFKFTKQVALLALFAFGTVSTSQCMWEKTKNFVKTDKTWKYVIGGISGVGAGTLLATLIEHLSSITSSHYIHGEYIPSQYTYGSLGSFLNRQENNYPLLLFATTVTTAFLAHKYSGLATAIVGGSAAALGAAATGFFAFGELVLAKGLQR